MELLLLIICILSAVAAILTQKSRAKRLPPGPFPWPIVGTMKKLKELSRKYGSQHEAMCELSRQYDSPVVSLRFGGISSNPCLVVNGVEAIRAVFDGEEFAGRPWNFFISVRNFGMKKGITMNDGEKWREIRSWFLRSMHSVGYGKREMSELLREELELVLRNIGDVDGSVRQMKPIIVPVIINVLWTFATGKRFDENKVQYFMELMERRARAFDITGGMLAVYPWMRFIAPNYSGYNLLKTVNQEFRAMLMETIEEHKKNFVPGSQADLIDIFLNEMYAGKDGFDVDQLVVILLDVLLAGLSVTVLSLEFLFLNILINQDSQKLLHEEIDRVIGQERLPDASDRAKMPYAEAVIMESQRVTPVMPVVAPRRVMRDTELLGFHVPRDASVLINVHSIYSDPKLYPEPNSFQPERFLREGSLIRDDDLILFGKGKRQCPGIPLATNSLFLIFIGIMQRYQLLPVPGQSMPSNTRIKPGMTRSPEPFDVFLVPRNNNNLVTTS